MSGDTVDRSLAPVVRGIADQATEAGAHRGEGQYAAVVHHRQVWRLHAVHHQPEQKSNGSTQENRERRLANHLLSKETEGVRKKSVGVNAIIGGQAIEMLRQTDVPPAGPRWTR